VETDDDVRLPLIKSGRRLNPSFIDPGLPNRHSHARLLELTEAQQQERSMFFKKLRMATHSLAGAYGK
jgi:hypothetical protein